MRNFFKPWRRRIGVVTLGLALLAVAGWVRGHTVRDFYQDWTVIGPSEIVYQLSFSHAGIMWSRCVEANPRRFLPTETLRGWFHQPISGSYVLPGDDSRVDQSEIAWRWKSCGFDFCEFNDQQSSDEQENYWNVPYYSIVIPLTLFSAWLLLVQPRQAKPKQATEPSPTIGA